MYKMRTNIEQLFELRSNDYSGDNEVIDELTNSFDFGESDSSTTHPFSQGGGTNTVTERPGSTTSTDNTENTDNTEHTDTTDNSAKTATSARDGLGTSRGVNIAITPDTDPRDQDN